MNSLSYARAMRVPTARICRTLTKLELLYSSTWLDCRKQKKQPPRVIRPEPAIRAELKRQLVRIEAKWEQFIAVWDL